MRIIIRNLYIFILLLLQTPDRRANINTDATQSVGSHEPTSLQSSPTTTTLTAGLAIPTKQDVRFDSSRKYLIIKQAVCVLCLKPNQGIYIPVMNKET